MSKPKKNRKVNDAISLTIDEAVTRIENWRSFIGSQFETHAFFIPIDDLLTLANEIKNNKGSGVRAYLSRNEDENELLVVGVKDLTILNEGGTDMVNEGIYDLTMPCPTMCDKKSILLTLGDKQNRKLRDLGKSKATSAKPAKRKITKK
ncbi:MAG: hypothetical protein JST81_01705 [Bacteroidetes bacterium]|nr:hypothetical protein [Bacteroidota bacterium]